MTEAAKPLDALRVAMEDWKICGDEEAGADNWHRNDYDNYHRMKKLADALTASQPQDAREALWGEFLDWLRERHREHADIAATTKDPAKKLNHESRELAFFACIKEWEHLSARAPLKGASEES